MTPVIEKALPADAGAIAIILSGWFHEANWMQRIHTYEGDRGFGRHLIEVCDAHVARVDSMVIGFLALQDGGVQALYFHPNWRVKRVREALLDCVKGTCQRLVLWTFQANIEARRFYERHGFENVQFTDGASNDEKLPDVQMVWEGREG